MTPAPLYRTLANDLRETILRGELPPGAALPTEHELQRARRLSRHTVREALRMLHAEGLIERRRGAGSYVRAVAPEGPYAQAIGDLDALLQYARSARLEVLTLRRRTPYTAESVLLDLDPAESWARVTGLRRRAPGGAPIALTRIYARDDLMPSQAEIEQWDGALNELIALRHGVTAARIEQDIAAVALGAREARMLDARARSPALKTMRRYRNPLGRVFQASISLHPGDRFVYSMQLDRA